MNGMRILMISPTPTHPQDAGNRARIFQLAEQLRSLGCDLFFVYCDMEEADLEGMREYWGKRICILPERSKTLRPPIKWNIFLTRLKKWLRGIGMGEALTPGGPLGVDDWFVQDLEETVRRLHFTRNFQIVWIEYVFLSKILCGFDSSVLRVIDTHDVFSKRYEMMRSQGMGQEWFYTTPEMEKKGLARADWVVAIHEKDAASFRALGLPQVVTIGHFARLHPPRGIPPRNRILFIGSENSNNLRAWEYFTNEMLSLVEKRLPGTSINVAGKICHRIPESSRYQKLGVVEDLGVLYESTTLAINPETWGTGLKIKTIEPLAYGCPVVTTSSGIQGIEEAENRGILVGRTPEEFVECIERLLTLPSFWEEQRWLAQDFLIDYLHRNQQRLSDLLDEAGPSKRKECSL